MHCFIFIFAAAFLLVASKNLPSYITPCRKDDPNLNSCAKQNAINALPSILKGDKSYRYPNLTPLNLPLIDIKPTDKLSITLKDVVLQGMESTEVRDIVLDLPKRNIKVTVAFKRLTLDCQYDIDGQILVLPIKGNGPAKMIFDGVVVDYSFDYDLIKKTDGLQYIDPNIRPKVTYTLDNAHYKFDNLFNGDKNLGDTMNEFLNEHGPEVNKDLGESISQTINAVATNIIQEL